MVTISTVATNGTPTLFRKLPNETKIREKSTIRKVIKTFILHINNSKSYEQIINKKNCSKKLVTQLFSASIDLPIGPNTCEFLQIFF